VDFQYVISDSNSVSTFFISLLLLSLLGLVVSIGIGP
jgi:hypothetical protein